MWAPRREYQAARLLGCAAAAVMFVANPVAADEGGVPFWFSGQYASLAAVPATPGWSLPIQGYYSGSASQRKSFTRGDSVALSLKSRSPLLMAQPSYAPETTLFGGQAVIGLGFGYGANTTAADISIWVWIFWATKDRKQIGVWGRDGAW